MKYFIMKYHPSAMNFYFNDLMSRFVSLSLSKRVSLKTKSLSNKSTRLLSLQGKVKIFGRHAKSLLTFKFLMSLGKSLSVKGILT